VLNKRKPGDIRYKDIVIANFQFATPCSRLWVRHWKERQTDR